MVRRRVAFFLGGPIPDIKPDERVYIAAHRKLRGYAPLVRIERYQRGRYALVAPDEVPHASGIDTGVGLRGVYAPQSVLGADYTGASS
jgi:hypothetical protein